MKEQITELTHPSMYAWFTKYIMIINIYNR